MNTENAARALRMTLAPFRARAVERTQRVTVCRPSTSFTDSSVSVAVGTPRLLLWDRATPVTSRGGMDCRCLTDGDE